MNEAVWFGLPHHSLSSLGIHAQVAGINPNLQIGKTFGVVARRQVRRPRFAQVTQGGVFVATNVAGVRALGAEAAAAGRVGRVRRGAG